MPLPNRELLTLERFDEIRALAPHITYLGLHRWFRSLRRHEKDMPATRQVVNEAGVLYNVQLWSRRSLTDTVSAQMSPIDQPNTTIFFRGRQGSMRDRETGKIITTENGRYKAFPYDLLGRERLAWRRANAGSLDLIAPGAVLGSVRNPPIITVNSPGTLTVRDAEALVLQAAPTDPDIIGPAYTAVPLFEIPIQRT